jgi:hypothetical protein
LGRERDGFITTVLPLLQNFKLSQFTLYYNQKARNDNTAQVNAGQLTLGGIDQTNCINWQFFNGLDDAFWSVKAIAYDIVTYLHSANYSHLVSSLIEKSIVQRIKGVLGSTPSLSNRTIYVYPMMPFKPSETTFIQTMIKMT